MPIKKASFKHLRQTKRRAARNNLVRNRIEDLRRTIRLTMEGKRQGNLDELMRSMAQALDKAAKTGVIKKNTAARTKSRLMRRVRAFRTTAVPAR